MSSRFYWVAAAAAFSMSVTCVAETSAITFEQLPEPVQKTVLEILDRPKVSKINRISEGNLLRFGIEADKVETDRQVMSWELVVAANGKLMKLSREVPYFSLTFPQMQAIEARFPGVKVTEAESTDLHFYDVVAEQNGQPLKFRLYEDGFIEEQP